LAIAPAQINFALASRGIEFRAVSPRGARHFTVAKINLENKRHSAS
jgi:hypothetical protein